MMTTILNMMILAKKMVTMDLKDPMGMILVKRTMKMDQKDPMEMIMMLEMHSIGQRQQGQFQDP
jgi:hypothetical protein